jgi:hypothetical protein
MKCTLKMPDTSCRSNDTQDSSCSGYFHKTGRCMNTNCPLLLCWEGRSGSLRNCCMSGKINGTLRITQYFHHRNNHRSTDITCLWGSGIALLFRCILCTRLLCLCTLGSCSCKLCSLVGMFLACIRNFLWL